MASTGGTLTTNTDSTTHKFKLAPGALAQGVHFHCSGTFGSGTMTVKFYGTDGTWHDIANGAFTAAADKTFSVPNNTSLKVTLSGSSGASIYYQFSDMNDK